MTEKFKIDYTFTFFFWKQSHILDSIVLEKKKKQNENCLDNIPIDK